MLIDYFCSFGHNSLMSARIIAVELFHGRILSSSDIEGLLVEALLWPSG